MDFNSAWQLILNLIESDWQVPVLIFAAILSLRSVKVLNPGVWSQLANLLGSAVASGLFNNVSVVNGLKMVVFSALSALAYHLYSKILAPQAEKLVARLKSK